MSAPDPLEQQRRIERHKTVRAGLWVAALLILAAILFGVYRFVTAPVRVAQDTTATVTQSVEETATAVLTVRHVEVREGRRFARLAERAHDVLSALPAIEPATVGERAFRAANLRGSQNRVCRFDMDFGAGTLVVWAAADNASFATNRAMGGRDERQVRLVFDTAEQDLGLNAQFDADEGWQLLWRRRNAARKPLGDATAATRALDALEAVPERCAVSEP